MEVKLSTHANSPVSVQSSGDRVKRVVCADPSCAFSMCNRPLNLISYIQQHILLHNVCIETSRHFVILCRLYRAKIYAVTALEQHILTSNFCCSAQHKFYFIVIALQFLRSNQVILVCIVYGFAFSLPPSRRLCFHTVSICLPVILHSCSIVYICNSSMQVVTTIKKDLTTVT